MRKMTLKNGWLNFLVDQQYTHAVTFKPNDKECPPTVDMLHRLFVKVHMLADRRILGSRFTSANRVDVRSHAMGIVEGMPNSGHLHGAFKIRPENWSKFEGLFADGTTVATRKGLWRRLLPHGTAVVKPIYEAIGWHDYAFKHVWQVNDSDRVIFLPLRMA